MSEPDFDYSEGSWEDFPGNEGPPWGEPEWYDYLKACDQNTSRFLSLYNSLQDKLNRLDEVAISMGWDAQDISLADVFQASDAGEVKSEENEKVAPYTLHRHPVIVVSHALYQSLNQSWEQFMQQSQLGVTPQTCWKYAQSLHQGEINVLFAIQGLDLGDFGLAVCHLKKSLTALNQTFTLLNQLDHPDKAFLEGFQQHARSRLFDLRELWIRVMGDCRAAFQRHYDGEQE